MTVQRWCENPVNGGPWVVLESDYDALLADRDRLRGLLTRWMYDRHDAEGISATLVRDTRAALAATADQPNAAPCAECGGTRHLFNGTTRVDCDVCEGTGTVPPVHQPAAARTDQMDCRNCHMCLRGVKVEFWNGVSLPVAATRMIVCPDCGNKRCPKASDHRLACTGSNEPGQPGSIYTRPADNSAEGPA